MTIRPLLPEDAEAAVAVAVAALPVPEPLGGDRAGLVRSRVGHLLVTDPGGAWVAEDRGAVTGVGLALVRDGIWGLSLLAVHPGLHARGTGRALLDAALAYGRSRARAGIIASSTDPRAMRLYARAGFELRPCVALAGVPDRSAAPAGVRARPSEDVEAAAALGRGVRGGAYGAPDLALLTAMAGSGLLSVTGRGFAVHRDGSPLLLCATDEEAATDLLWSCLTAGPRGGTVHLDFLTAGQDWAVRAGLRAGLALSPEGPLFTCGALGPLRPWIPSGVFL